eukprot:TRINITY_DN1911_c0_g8_i1.p1 TRINITY_DN1911_c0_g8~~TRINITY_DN1911_c0_g8_i1.p1  ORF type:complete len:211 (+),score=54.59 TRINITY_DN1911_c0_g8_i1:170-802(+)
MLPQFPVVILLHQMHSWLEMSHWVIMLELVFGSVLRGDLGSIQVGFSSVIADKVIIHPSTKNDENAKTVIGEHVYIGNGSIIYPCTIGDEVYIEPGTIIMPGAVIEKFSVLKYGTVVGPGQRITSGQVWEGSPATAQRELNETEALSLREVAKHQYGSYLAHLQGIKQSKQERENDLSELLSMTARGTKSPLFWEKFGPWVERSYRLPKD